MSHSDELLMAMEEFERDLLSLLQRFQILKLRAQAERGVGVPQVLKSSSGRLTDAGVEFLRSLIKAGRLDSEIARELNISQSAVHHQRKSYLAEFGKDDVNMSG